MAIKPKTNIATIGSKELVDFPDLHIFDIPAKVDTGADSSAIWASNIREIEGMLSFTLFSEGSAYFTGEVITTGHYKIVTVKNSFGTKEMRYVVSLSLRLNSKRYRVRFNLADRSRSHFPILLGRRFLNKKFIVDVSKKYELTDSASRPVQKRILVMTSKVSDEGLAFFENVSDKSGLSIDLCRYTDVSFYFGEQPIVRIGKANVDIASYDLVYFKSRKNNLEEALAMANYLQYKNVAYLDKELETAVSLSKLSEMMILNTHLLNVPASIVAATPLLLDRVDGVIEYVGLPLILKDVFSDRGRHNYLVSTKSELKELLENAPTECLFAAQSFIPNDGFVRILVLGKEVRMIVVRASAPNADPQKRHLNKPFGGDNARLVSVTDFDNKVINLALKSAKVLRRQSAGVDLLCDKVSGKWYILEVNPNPQMLTKKFSNEKAQALASFLNYEIEKW